jgi:hypothetical protein
LHKGAHKPVLAPNGKTWVYRNGQEVYEFDGVEDLEEACWMFLRILLYVQDERVPVVEEEEEEEEEEVEVTGGGKKRFRRTNPVRLILEKDKQTPMKSGAAGDRKHLSFAYFCTDAESQAALKAGLADSSVDREGLRLRISQSKTRHGHLFYDYALLFSRTATTSPSRSTLPASTPSPTPPGTFVPASATLGWS